MRKIFLLFTLFASFTQLCANNEIIVSDVTVPKGNTGMIIIELNNDDVFTAFTFKLTLPEGLSYVLDESEEPKPTFNLGSRFTDHGVSSSSNGKVASFGCLSISSAPISGSNGMLLSVYIRPDESLDVGDELTATLSEVTFTTPSEVEYNLSDVNIDITIGEPADPRTLLDENSTTAPEASGGPVDVRVRRTIAAGNWSTICLPFAMTAAQVVDAFGDGVQLADFTGVDSEFDAADNVIGITANFSAVTAIEANHPYIIKVSTAISEFVVDGVTIDPVEDDAYVEFDNGKTGSRRVVYSGFYGTYKANTSIPKFCLFLNNNSFYYSTGQTKSKAFRAFFEFLDILTEVGGAGVKMFVDFDDEETKVMDINNGQAESGDIFDIMGRKVSKPNHKGVYIVGGKKVLFK